MGLQHAHEHDLVHRDIKPSNLMLNADGQVKILDLGLARLTGEHVHADEATTTGQVVGTGDFIAPEQGQDTRQADARSDIYALGCTLYFLLAGKAPFSGTVYHTFVEKVMAHAREPIPPIQTIRHDVPDGVAAILERMTAKRPDQRFQSAAEIAEALTPLAKGSDLRSVVAGRGAHPNGGQEGQDRRRTWGGYGFVAIILIVLAVLGYRYAGALLLVLRGEGVLVVEGDKADVSLVAQSANGSTVQLDLDEGRNVRLKAGQYDIRVSSGEAGAVVEPEQVTIRRGGQSVVELRHTAPVAMVAGPALAQSKELVNSIGMRFVQIRAGEFTMGSPDSEADREDVEGPQHKVRITRPFYLGVYEVTQAQYRHVTGKSPSFYAPTGEGAEAVRGLNTDDFPVDSIRWEDAVAFCRALSEMDEERRAGRSYRLPTEAEWEYACRAGMTTPFHYGESLSSEQANFKGNFPYGTAAHGPFVGHPMPVGSYKPNAFGIYDMHGNAWEWCQDWYSPDYYRASPSDDPRGPEAGPRHAFRGGGWGVSAKYCRLAFRNREIDPTLWLYSLGFRVVLIPSEKPFSQVSREYHFHHQNWRASHATLSSYCSSRVGPDGPGWL